MANSALGSQIYIELSDPVFEVFGTPNTAFEFDTSSLSGLTAGGLTPDTENADTTVPGHLYIQDNAAGTGFCARYATAPAAPFTAITYLNTNARDNYNSACLFVGVATPGAVDVLQFGNAATYRMVFLQRWTNLTTWSSDIASTVQIYPSPIWLAIVANSSTDYDYVYSTDGYVWRAIQVARDPSLTIGSVGIGLQSQNTSGAAAAFDYLRIWNSALVFPGV